MTALPRSRYRTAAEIMAAFRVLCDDTNPHPSASAWRRDFAIPDHRFRPGAWRSEPRRVEAARPTPPRPAPAPFPIRRPA